MKVLVTGSNGFIGKNLITALKNHLYTDVYEYDKGSAPADLEKYCREADIIYHLAGINRPEEETQYREGNVCFTQQLLALLKKSNRSCPVIYSSSIQAVLNNPYGISKKAGEDAIIAYAKETGAKISIYRLPNVFGKWCRPNYNSAVATFCHNISHDLPITINRRETLIKLVYIDDLVEELLGAMDGSEIRDGYFCEVPVIYLNTLGRIADLIYSFHSIRDKLALPDMSDAFTKKLYSTYLSYLPKDGFGNELTMHTDQRGCFTEFLKQAEFGQLSVNRLKPGIIKGNHWHNTKVEKFLVVSGKGVIRLREIFASEVITYAVDGEKLKVIDIPVGYTHQIINTGDTDMVTLIWANECFQPEFPDTYPMEV